MLGLDPENIVPGTLSWSPTPIAPASCQPPPTYHRILGDIAATTRA